MSLAAEVFDGWGYYGPGIEWDNVTVTVNMQPETTPPTVDSSIRGC